MKRYILLFVVLSIQINFAQSIFPTDGSNVGIGTITPTSKLEVKGTIKSFEFTPLADPIGSSQLINEVGTRGGTAITANNIFNRLWIYRDNASQANWLTTRLHDGIAVDASFNTPQVDTKTWWERDPYDNIQSWGNAAQTYVTINKGNVGIGTITPLAKLEVNSGNILVRNSANVDSESSIMIAHSINAGSLDTFGTSIRTITQSAGNNTYGMQIFTQESYATNQTEKIRIQGNGNVGIGTTNPVNKLDVNGTIHSKEVKVDMLGWPDYVFKKEYNLPTLEEVEKHINEKGHLENIPSEEEVLKNGINLGEMNAKLLQKMEEMTLYMIEQNKRMNKIEKENQELKIKLESIKK